MSDIMRAAADACPGDTPHSRATVAASERLTIPTDMRGKFCAFSAEGQDVFVRFGTATDLEVSATAVSTVDTEVLTAAATTPHIHVPAGTTVQIRLQRTWTKMAHISPSTGGYFRFGLAQGGFGAD